MTALRVGELFAGIGGFGLGLERSGMRVCWQVEIDEAARGVLTRHWPGVQRHTDVREVGAGSLEAVDLIAGGFPCQDVSVAGRRAGLGGERSGLWWEFHRILSELRPRWCLIENVPGLLSSNGGRDMGAILWALGKLGYGYAYRVLDAQRFGLAQRRKRVWIVGCLGDGRRAAQVLLEPEGVRWNPETRSAARSRVAGTLSASSSRNRGLGNGNECDSIVAGTLTEASHAGGNGLQAGCQIVAPLARSPYGDHVARESQLVAHALTSSGHDASENGTGRVAHALTSHPGGYRFDDTNDTLVADPICANEQRITSHAGNNPRPRNVVPVYGLRSDASREGKAKTPSVDAGGRERLRDPGFNVLRELAPTLQEGAPHSVGVPFVGVRRLTPKECERLQGFPDKWTYGRKDAPRYAQLGNAVPVNVVTWIGDRIVAADAAERAA